MDIPNHFGSHLNIVRNRLLQIGYLDWIRATFEADDRGLIQGISGGEIVEECNSVESRG